MGLQGAEGSKSGRTWTYLAMALQTAVHLDGDKLVALGWRRWGSLDRGWPWAWSEEDALQTCSGGRTLETLCWLECRRQRRENPAWGVTPHGVGSEGEDDGRTEGPTRQEETATGAVGVLVGKAQLVVTGALGVGSASLEGT